MDWVHSHTPDEIRIANNARIQLRRQFKDRVSPRGLRKIEDDRAPKRPALAYATFFGDRSVSPDFKTIKVSDRAKLIAQEWKALNAGEKKVRLFMPHAVTSPTYSYTEIPGSSQRGL
jgi:hypothetical protein